MLMESLQLFKIMLINNRTSWFYFLCFLRLISVHFSCQWLWSVRTYQSGVPPVRWSHVPAGRAARCLRCETGPLAWRRASQVPRRSLVLTLLVKKIFVNLRNQTRLSKHRRFRCAQGNQHVTVQLQSWSATRTVKTNLRDWMAMGSVLFLLQCVGSLRQL